MKSQLTTLPSRKIPVAITLIVVSIIYAVWQNMSGTQTIEMNPPVVSNTSQVVSSQNNSTPSATTQATSTTQPQKSSGLYVDGTYTGAPENAYYGTVQVQAVVQNGALSNVTFLQYPSDRSTSRTISSRAMPILVQEALQIQSAKVDGVSGATQISDAFKQSLASALSQAQN